MDKEWIERLGLFLDSVPSVETISYECPEDGKWRLKIRLDIDHPLAWNVVQELGHILNSISTEEKLPMVFMPISAPPYLN